MKKRRRVTRILSCVLSLMMLLSTFPINVFAAANGTDILAIAAPRTKAIILNYDQYVGTDDVNKKLDLPSTVTVTKADSTTEEAAVVWDTESLNVKKAGTYSLPGTVTLPDGATNGGNLTVNQKIIVRTFENLLSNSGFESGSNSPWYLNNSNKATDKEKRTGQYSGLAKVGISGTTWSKQAGYNYYGDSKPADVGQKITELGIGQYYFSGWVKAATSNDNVLFRARLRITPEGAKESTSTFGNELRPDTSEFAQSSGIAAISAKTISTARLDLEIMRKNNTIELAESEFYFDDMELLPLNITLATEPASPGSGDSTDITAISAPAPKAIILRYGDYVGSENVTAKLGLPEKVTVTKAGGDIVDASVSWNTDSLDVNTLGTYTLPGTVTLPDGLTNTQNLTVNQIVVVRNYTNLLQNPSFEETTDGWYFRAETTLVSDPVKDGAAAVSMAATKTTGWQVQAAYLDGDTVKKELGTKVRAYGAGQYYFSAWAQSNGENTPENANFLTMLRYGTPESGENSKATAAGKTVHLDASTYVQSKNILELPSDTTWVRLELWLRSGDGNQEGNSADISGLPVYLDHAELIPINVTLSSASNVQTCEVLEPITAAKGTAFGALNLPDSVMVTLDNGQAVALGVKWSDSGYDASATGIKTIRGTLELLDTYTNTNNIAPSITVSVTSGSSKGTIYFSTSGNDENHGLTPELPKKDITKIPELMKQGYDVKLKCGDTWYLPTYSLYLSQVNGTEDAPRTLSAYGNESDGKPVIAFMKPIENTAWVSLGDNVYRADISDLEGKLNSTIPSDTYTHYVHRTFVDGEPYLHVDGAYTTLNEKQFCDGVDDGTTYIYVKTDGDAPTNVELTPICADEQYRLQIYNSKYVRIENIALKGGSGSVKFARILAPTTKIVFDNCDFTYTSGYVLKISSFDETVNVSTEISHCLIDAMLSESEGSHVAQGIFDLGQYEGIDVVNAAEALWVHDCTIRNMSHAAIELEVLDAATIPNIHGIHRSIIEDNVIEGVNACYSRFWGISDATNSRGENLATNNIFRRNKCYDMTTSTHILGVDNAMYGNIISYTHNRAGMSGKGPQPYGIDVIPWGSHVSKRNVVLNNTFYDMGSGIVSEDTGEAVDNNLYANNLFVNWTEDNELKPGAVNTKTNGTMYFMNNGFYTVGKEKCVYQDGIAYTPEEANKLLSSYSGNVFANPQFATASLERIKELAVRQDYALSNTSPYRYSGLALTDELCERFPILKTVKADYTDVGKNAYAASAPSVGAVSYTTPLSGTVASVAEIPAITVRTGTEISNMVLPESVKVTLQDGDTVNLGVTWSAGNYDASKAGTYTLSGTLDGSAHASLSLNGKQAACTVVAKDQLELVSIRTASAEIAAAVLQGTTKDDAIAKLPSSVSVIEENYFTEELPVSWTSSDYDPNTPGDYIFRGQIASEKLTNPEAGILETTVTVIKALKKGDEILENPDFIEGESYVPWVMEWESGKGTAEITTDAALLKDGEPAAVIVNPNNRYGSIGQNVTNQVKRLGDGKYLAEVWMRTLESGVTIESSNFDIQVLGSTNKDYGSAKQYNIGNEYVQFRQILEITNTAGANTITFHTSTGKTKNDVGKAFLIAGCSLIYLGSSDDEVNVTLDKLSLTWDAIRGANDSQENITSDLTLPGSGENGSTITWASSNGDVISSTGKFNQSRFGGEDVRLTATITKNGAVDTVSFDLKVKAVTSDDLPVIHPGSADSRPNDDKKTIAFSDVSERDWFYDDVAFVCEKGIMNGTGQNAFGSDQATTRGMFVTILYRMENEPTTTDQCPFTDVKSSRYYEKAVTWAAKTGIVGGYGNGCFGADQTITREQLAVILFRYAQWAGYRINTGSGLYGFRDYDDISMWAATAMSWANANGLINGTSEDWLDPGGSATRCQAAAILHRFYDIFVK